MAWDYRIQLDLCIAPRRVCISNARQLGTLKGLNNRPIQEAVRLIPILFGLCGTAQGLCAVTAAEQALGITVSEEIENARALALKSERIADHGLTLARDWPLMIGENASLDSAKVLLNLARLRTRLFDDWTKIGGSNLRPAVIDTAQIKTLISAILGANLDSIAQDPDAFLNWVMAQQSPAARLLNECKELGPCTTAFRPLNLAPDAEFEDQLADAEFRQTPHVHGQCCETGPLARVADQRLIQFLLAEFGPAPLTRFAARIVELWVDLADPNPHRPTGFGASSAHVQATRGLLVQQFVLNDHRVDTFRSVAPTEWNFHPQGILADTLQTVPQLTERFAQLAAHSMDACVETRINLGQSENA